MLVAGMLAYSSLAWGADYNINVAQGNSTPDNAFFAPYFKISVDTSAGPAQTMAAADPLAGRISSPDISAPDPAAPAAMQAPTPAGAASIDSAAAAPQTPPRWWHTTAGKAVIAIGATGLSMLADRELDQWAKRNHEKDLNRILGDTKDILPIYAIGFAAATSFQSPWANEKLAHASTVAIAAGALTYVETIAVKQITGRWRPSDTDDPTKFEPFSGKYDVFLNGPSFPSGHTSLSWAVVTPYAKAYDAPWLYALPVISGVGRVLDDAHWFSDVVAGGFLGYYTADFLYHRFPKGDVGMLFTGNGIGVFGKF
ncbi:MAG: phosphatase PAP2 family protein [Pseudomonadota bacterium]